MKQEIFTKTLPNKTTVHVFRDNQNDTTTWEIILTNDQESTRRSFSVSNSAILERAAQGRPEKFIERLTVYDALLDPTRPALLLVVDKFGEVDVLRYGLNTNNTFDFSNVEILPLHNYQLVARDVQLLGEHIEDVTTYGHTLIAASRSAYQYYDSYFISVLDLDKKVALEYRLSTIELTTTSSEIEDASIQDLIGIRLNSIGLTKVLDSVQQNSNVGVRKLLYKFALLSDRFKQSVEQKTKLHSDAFFFVDIGNVPMIMFFIFLNKWYIAPESVMKPIEHTAPHASYNDIFIYK